jgi:hypothetical protein
VPQYKVTVLDPTGAVAPGVSWKRYKSDSLLEYGNEIVVESDSPDGPGSIRARVTEVDNDAFFTNKVTVEPIGASEQHES